MLHTITKHIPIRLSGLQGGYNTKKSMLLLVSSIVRLTITVGAVLVTLIGVLYAERLLLRAAEDNSSAVENQTHTASKTGTNSPRSPQDDLKLLREDPFGAAGLFINSLKDSTLLELLEGISLITAMILFLLHGRQEQIRWEHYQAWSMIDAAHKKETSYARFYVLQDLNKQGISLQGLDAEGADLIHIDLQEADLHECTLTHAKLRKANFSYSRMDFSNLSRANLERSILHRCHFLGANFREATLGGADLTKADLRSADLSDADLQYAKLFFTDLQGANLKGANLEGADLREADFRKARHLKPDQIKQAINWQTAKYDGDFWQQLIAAPSSLLSGDRTIQCSRSPTPTETSQSSSIVDV